MTQTSLAKRIALAAAGGLVSCLLVTTASSAAEIKVLTSVALTSALNEVAPNFEQTTGNKLNIGYSLIADIKKRMLEGETADVIILSRPVMDELHQGQRCTTTNRRIAAIGQEFLRDYGIYISPISPCPLGQRRCHRYGF